MDLYIFSIFIACNIIAAEKPIVTTKIGSIRGVLSSDGNVNMFMGIPYATVNESNPFGVSIPHKGFDTLFEANNDSSKCPQIEEFNLTLVGDIDCLRINIYTPSLANSKSRFPVFVWIYGGGFELGFYGRFMYGPKYLVRHGIILVTINYRLGPYGFMCLDIPEVPGNQGFKDTLLALRWVNEHIESFGGDASKITLGGNSAGANAVDYHLVRKLNDKPLFRNAILQSGNINMPLLGEPDKNYAHVVANELGKKTNDVYEAIAFLATVPPLKIIKIVSKLKLNIGPCSEKQFDGIEAFFTGVNSTMHHVKNVSILIGILEDEAYWKIATHDTNPDMVYLWLNDDFDTEHKSLTGVNELRNFYFGNREPGENMLRATTDFSSDFNFNYPTHRTIKSLLKDDVKRLYYYMFAHEGKRGFVKYREPVAGGGPVHADELGYIFDMEFMPDTPTPEDQLVIDKMTAMWTNFVKYSDPTPETTELLDVKWLPVTASSPQHCMMITKELVLISRPFLDRMSFWDLFYNINRHLLKAFRNI